MLANNKQYVLLDSLVRSRLKVSANCREPIANGRLLPIDNVTRRVKIGIMQALKIQLGWSVNRWFDSLPMPKWWGN